ncbi:tubulin-specific chaperone E [Chelonus insularis]|uniref:tubulin-specific chaperone E n=1 Tax=Chelonus insularis TaxID=460826 RepID=UPI00158D360A|nr:tubulin-specific chaperone E [Chelonus insularis]
MGESTNILNDSYQVGNRIDCDGHRGTIRYIGPVIDTNGMWLGIDWDESDRGKHNGTYHGIEYFKTRYPTSGSFVRPGKVKTGVSCPESIKNRYGLIDDELAGVEPENVTSLKKEINAPFLEMVGFSKVNKKQSTFNKLKIVWLRDQLVSCAGAPGELEELCPNVEQLDISRNLINSWRTVGDICWQLKHLEHLDVSENILPTPEDGKNLKNAFTKVNQLTMARMNYTWDDVEWCTSLFPSLKILHVPFNNICILKEPETDASLKQLVVLSLEGNGINDWTEILKLGKLESLENLNLNSNNIDVIRLPRDDENGKTSMFPALRQLHLSKNLINEWISISELEKLKNLEDLKFRDNPLLNDVEKGTARQLIIARISNLKLLNSTEITRDERNGAEYDYLKLCFKEWQQINSESSENCKKIFLENHPRYLTLIQLCGEPEITNSKTDLDMKSDLITVEFICMNESSQCSSVKKKLLKEMDVQKLTGLVQRIFKTRGKIPKLSFVGLNRLTEEIPLDKPLQQLSYYSIQNGDHILVRW